MLPEVFAKRMQRMLGEEYEAYLEELERERSQGLWLNPLKQNVNGHSVTALYGADNRKAFGFAHLSRVPWAEHGYYYASSDQPGKHPLHEAGVYYIQEPSAMAPVELLGVQPGERILDLCAAPGGKSVQIAGKLQGKGLLLCNEIHPGRAKILSENIERMGICNACVTNETPERLAERFSGYFDRVLVDAPCSGEGMFRKNETACEEWSLENVRLCAKRQDGILDYAALMLRQGGRLVYSTCTFAPEEDEGSVSRFIQRHPEFHMVPVDKERMGLAGCDGEPEYIEDPVPGVEWTVRLWPQRIRGEGHFAAVLQKGDELSPRQPDHEITVTTKGIEKAVLDAMTCFCAENLNCDAQWIETCADDHAQKRTGTEDMLGELARATGLRGELRCIAFGDNLYLSPMCLPSLKGIKVLRPGLHLGQMKKKRFEPAHALALALSPVAVAHVRNMDSHSHDAAAYLNGQTFPAEGEKGWYLVCVDGFGLGWGKLSGGVMKNHYPRGLRIQGYKGVTPKTGGEG